MKLASDHALDLELESCPSSVTGPINCILYCHAGQALLVVNRSQYFKVSNNVINFYRISSTLFF